MPLAATMIQRLRLIIQRLLCCVLVLHLCQPARALADSPAQKLLKQKDAWFLSDQGREVMEHLLAWQSPRGDWPKNQDTTRKPKPKELQKSTGTFDNGATTGELRALARAYRLTEDQRYLTAFERGFTHILNAQYPSGGWPQFSPPGKGYHRHITFNDNCMIRLLEFLQDVSQEEDFRFLNQPQRDRAADAVQRGVECLLKCQIKVDGELTVWCAQHDELSFEPVAARSFELRSLSGGESAGILRFLMDIDQPSEAVVQAVRNGVAWYEKSRIDGYEYQRRDEGPSLVPAKDARPLWARFYEIETNRPIFCGRDGVMKYDLQQIDAERRGGYAWYGHWGEDVLKAYRKWPYRDSAK